MTRCFRLLQHLCLVGNFFAHALIIKLIHHDPIKRRQAFVKNTSRIARKFIKAFRISLRVDHPERMAALKDQAYLLVANHGSYTDIIILSALEELTFITSVEMGNNYFLGPITRYGGSLFTNRKRPVSLKQEIQNFSDAIMQGFKVVLFAEGTSTDGRTVKEFRKSLFQVAINARCPVLPVCINYRSIDGKPIDDCNRDMIYWYGDMNFGPHFMKLLNRRIEAEVHILESLAISDGKMRAELSDEVFGSIHACYHSAKERT